VIARRGGKVAVAARKHYVLGDMVASLSEDCPMITRPGPHEPHSHGSEGWASALVLAISLALVCAAAVLASVAAPWS
jgi:hypothetical protein